MESITRVTSFDGQTIWQENRVALYEVGNFLGGGAAGTVYEAEHAKSKEHFALKILNPLGYKMTSPSLLRRCTVLLKGKAVPESMERSKAPIGKENVWWLLNANTKQYLVAYYSERQHSLNELSLVQCMNIWGVDLPEGEEASSPNRGASSPSRNNIPSVPPKYADFVRRRGRIFREIRNMRKISPHVNVIRLESVLELAQDTKCTIFLVMELANGGELFDRIKIDCGTVEDTARKFFCQLLRGVRHCHEEGVCHRDLKPENLLLQDSANGPILKIADFGFSARLAMADGDVAQEGPTSPASSIPLYSSNGSGNASPSGAVSTPMRVLLSVVGSPFYVAPEVLQAQGYDGRKADSWSLGVILYAMLAGNLPFSQDLSSCKRFRQFCIWAREQSAISSKFWQDPSLECPSWLFSVKFSYSVRGLIVAMLLPDPKDRISVKEAQEHIWCKFFDRSQERDRDISSIKPVPDASSDRDGPSSEGNLVSATSEAGVVETTESVPIDVLTLSNHSSQLENNNEGGSSVTDAKEDKSVLGVSSPPGGQVSEVSAACLPSVQSASTSFAKQSDREENNVTSEQYKKQSYASLSDVDSSICEGEVGIGLMDVESDYDNDDSGAEERHVGDSEGVDVNEMVEQFHMDDEEDDTVNESASKRSKKSPGSSSRRFDFKDCKQKGSKLSGSLFCDQESSLVSNDYVAEPPLIGVGTHDDSNCEKSDVPRHPDSFGRENSPRIPRSPFDGGWQMGGSGLTSSHHSTSTLASSPRRSMATPPPIPTTAIPFIVGTPDLLSYEEGCLSSNNDTPLPVLSNSSDATNCRTPSSLSRLLEESRQSNEMARKCSPANESPTADEVEANFIGGKKPPSFHDIVKRSTRFITSVPASEVLETVGCILEQCRIHKTESPVGIIGHVEVSWDRYTLQVWGADAHSSSPALCSLHLYQLPQSQCAVGSPIRPGGVGTQLFLVEFVRGQLEIFAFKRFYEWIRQKVTELVKRDYAFNLFDQGGSPIQTPGIASSPLRGIANTLTYAPCGS